MVGRTNSVSEGVRNCDATASKLGWVVRGVLPLEGFCHGAELDDKKIVTLSRHLYQHARPVSEGIRDPGN